MEVFLLWLVFSFVAGVIADRKGRSGGWIFILSVLLSPLIGIVVALVLQPNRGRLDEQAMAGGDLKRCPFCAELVQRIAIKCKHCASDLPSLPSPARLTPQTTVAYRAGKELGDWIRKKNAK